MFEICVVEFGAGSAIDGMGAVESGWVILTGSHGPSALSA